VRSSESIEIQKPLNLGYLQNMATMANHHLKVFFAGFEYYRVTFNEVQTDVDGNIGLAWGFYAEEFKRKAQDLEKVRVRFTITFKYQKGRWRTLLYHRDIQQFDDQGRYLPSPSRGAN
jgi:hypothetical protein